MRITRCIFVAVLCTAVLNSCIHHRGHHVKAVPVPAPPPVTHVHVH